MPSAQVDRLIHETAAVLSSADVLIEFTKAGYGKKQAVAARNATAEILVKADGYMSRAHCHLANAGFTRNEREQLIGIMAVATHGMR